MTPEDAAFLSAIIEAPDDDGPRLIYADWLEDHGQPERAEFIRVQVELARLPQDDALGAVTRRGELEARERALLRRRERGWLGPLRKRAKKWKFRRGFVEEVEVEAGDFLAHAAAILALAPVRRVDLHRGWGPVEATLRRLAACDGLARLAGVRLAFGYKESSDSTLQALASLPPLLERLEALHAMGGSISEAGLAAVVCSPRLRRLRTLWLSGCGLSGVRGVRPLTESRRLSGLNHLSLHTNAIGDEGVQALAASPNWRSLAALDLARCDAGPAGAAALAGSPHLGGLLALFLSENAVGDEGAAALAGSPQLSGLAALHLRANAITDAGALALADSPHLDSLEILAVADNHISKQAIGRLRARFGDGVVV
jgi:uncharacterized protein (TIGR02996 family)